MVWRGTTAVCVAACAALVSCQGHREVSPSARRTAVAGGKAKAPAAVYGQSQTSSYPDIRDYLEAGFSGALPPPATGAPPRLRRDADLTRYTVVRGDTLFRIGRRYGASVASIKAANGLTTDSIFPGDVLTIPRE